MSPGCWETVSLRGWGALEDLHKYEGGESENEEDLVSASVSIRQGHRAVTYNDVRTIWEASYGRWGHVE
jgi:hypothetical protein